MEGEQKSGLCLEAAFLFVFFLVSVHLAENHVMEMRCVCSPGRTAIWCFKITAAQRDIHDDRANEKDGNN